MIIKILGILDIFIAIVFWLFGMFNIIPSQFILLLGMILLVKGLIFITGLSITSFLDILSGILILTATAINMPHLVVVLISLFLLQKGIFSLMS
jgi:hypothetical protein